MYFHYSLEKITVVAVVCFVLYGGVVWTMLFKERWYGSTPPFATIAYAVKEINLRSWYIAEKAIGYGAHYAGVYIAFLDDEKASESGTQNRLARGIPVLTYHRIVDNASDTANVTEDMFRDQMRTLKNAGWETITLKEYEEFMKGNVELKERSFLITFDDGAKDSFYPVDPLFQALGYTGVMYIIAAAPHTPSSVYYMTAPEISRMLKTGRWEIGSHSYDGHRPYPSGEGGTIDGVFFADFLWRPHERRLETAQEFDARVTGDLLNARETLQKEYGVSINTFAFPLGNETGVEGAANYPDGAALTEERASELYSIGFLQTNQHTFTFNYPGQKFISRRIHVDHDWNGARLLLEMEQGLEKDLPYDDDFSKDRGWIVAWGALDIGRNNLSLNAEAGASSVSTFLDGTKYWDNYSYDATLSWQNGAVFLLADVQNSKTYTSCAYSDGVVKIESTRDGETRVVAEKRDSRIAPGDAVRIGIRVHGSTIECTWNYASIVESYEREHFVGGIGLQAWNPTLGTAELHVSQILVRPFSSQTASSSPS